MVTGRLPSDLPEQVDHGRRCVKPHEDPHYLHALAPHIAHDGGHALPRQVVVVAGQEVYVLYKVIGNVDIGMSGPCCMRHLIHDTPDSNVTHTG